MYYTTHILTIWKTKASLGEGNNTSDISLRNYLLVAPVKGVRTPADDVNDIAGDEDLTPTLRSTEQWEGLTGQTWEEHFLTTRGLG